MTDAAPEQQSTPEQIEAQRVEIHQRYLTRIAASVHVALIAALQDPLAMLGAELTTLILVTEIGKLAIGGYVARDFEVPDWLRENVALLDREVASRMETSLLARLAERRHDLELLNDLSAREASIVAEQEEIALRLARLDDAYGTPAPPLPYVETAAQAQAAAEVLIDAAAPAEGAALAEEEPTAPAALVAPEPATPQVIAAEEEVAPPVVKRPERRRRPY